MMMMSLFRTAYNIQNTLTIFIQYKVTGARGTLFIPYFGFELKSSYHIASLFHIYIDMGERIAGEQDMPSVIIEGPPPPPKANQLAKNIQILAHIWKTGFQLFSLVHMSPLTFWCPRYPWIYVRPHVPEPVFVLF